MTTPRRLTPSCPGFCGTAALPSSRLPRRLVRRRCWRTRSAQPTRARRFSASAAAGDSGRPLCIWSEMPLGMLRAWVRRHVDNPETPIYADCMRSVDQIREQVDQLKPQAVIVDSLTAMAAARESNTDLWRATDVRNLIDGVRAAGSAALIVHHVRKGDGQIRDSSDIAAAADMLVELERRQTERRGARPGRNAAPADVPRPMARIDTAGSTSTRRPGATPRRTNRPTRKAPAWCRGRPKTAWNVAVTKYLKQNEHDGASVRQVARALGRRDAAVRGSLKRVADRGADERWRPSRGGRPETPDPYVGPTPVPKGRPPPRPDPRPGRPNPIGGDPRPGRPEADAPGAMARVAQRHPDGRTPVRTNGLKPPFPPAFFTNPPTSYTKQRRRWPL